MEDQKPREPFLTPEHWRQVLPIVIPIVIPLLLFLGIMWADHGQVARNQADIALLMQVKDNHDRRITMLEGDDAAQKVNDSRLGGQLDNLATSVNNLTLSVKGLTDLLPENRHR